MAPPSLESLPAELIFAIGEYCAELPKKIYYVGNRRRVRHDPLSSLSFASKTIRAHIYPLLFRKFYHESSYIETNIVKMCKKIKKHPQLARHARSLSFWTHKTDHPTARPFTSFSLLAGSFQAFDRIQGLSIRIPDEYIGEFSTGMNACKPPSFPMVRSLRTGAGTSVVIEWCPMVEKVALSPDGSASFITGRLFQECLIRLANAQRLRELEILAIHDPVIPIVLDRVPNLEALTLRPVDRSGIDGFNSLLRSPRLKTLDVPTNAIMSMVAHLDEYKSNQSASSKRKDAPKVLLQHVPSLDRILFLGKLVAKRSGDLISTFEWKLHADSLSCFP